MTKFYYSFKPETFAELPKAPRVNCSDAYHAHNAVCYALAHVLKGGEGADKVVPAVEEVAKRLNVPPDRLLNFANTIAEKDLPVLTTIHKELPGVDFAPHPYQIETAAWAGARYGSILNFDCGVGKTLTAMLAAANAVTNGVCSNERLFIICPVNAFGTWEACKDTLKHFFKEVFIASCDSLHLLGGLEYAPGGALIIDELHKFKSYKEKSNNTRQNRTLLAHKIRPAFEWCVGLTGTLFTAGADGVFSMNDLVCPGLSRFTNYYSFGYYFRCICDMDIGTGVKKPKAVPIPEEHKALFSRYMLKSARSLTYEHKEVGKHVNRPESAIKLVHIMPDVHVPSNKWAEYQENEWMVPVSAPKQILLPAVALALYNLDLLKHKEQLSEFNETDLALTPLDLLKEPEFPSNVRVFQTICRLGTGGMEIKATRTGAEFVESNLPGPKLTWLLDWLKQKENENESIVVGANFIETLDFVEAALKQNNVTYRRIDGSVNARKRTEYVKLFQEGMLRVILGQEVAMSESVNLTFARYSVLLDHSFQSIPYVQFIHRTARQGQKRITTHFDLIVNEVQKKIVTLVQNNKKFDADIQRLLEQESGLDAIKHKYTR